MSKYEIKQLTKTNIHKTQKMGGANLAYSTQPVVTHTSSTKNVFKKQPKLMPDVYSESNDRTQYHGLVSSDRNKKSHSKKRRGDSQGPLDKSGDRSRQIVNSVGRQKAGTMHGIHTIPMSSSK